MVPPTTRLTVLPEWIDHNGHMNVAYYVLAFDHATDAVYESWAVGEAYPRRAGCSLFTLGMDVDYLAELFADDAIRITTQLLDWDHKRLHYLHQMWRGESPRLVAVNECLAMNVNLESRRSAPFPPEVQRRLAEVHERHRALERPAGWGRRLSIRRSL